MNRTRPLLCQVILGMMLIPLATFTASSLAQPGEAKAAPEAGAAKPIPTWSQWPFDAAEAARRRKSTAEALKIEPAIDLDCGNGVKLKLVLIPAGQFMMGSPQAEKDRKDDEGPQRRVTLSRPFYMAVCEITQAQFEAIEKRQPWKGKVWTREAPEHPASNITWNDATALCAALAKKTGREIRLPTEAEWEYACRAGSSTRFGYGDDPGERQIGDYGWTSGNVTGKDQFYSRPVGRKKPNAFGLHDMHGNVYEWCQDRYQRSYEKLPATDPVGPAEGTQRVLRGGCWNYKTKLMRSAARFSDSPTNAIVTYGFRVVLPVGAPQDEPAR